MHTMTMFHKASLGLFVLAALSQGGAAHAFATLDVTPAAPTENAGVYTYSYSITSVPQTFPQASSFNPNNLNFVFTDPNVSFVSGPSGFSATQTGSDIDVSSTTTHLTDGTPATFAFSSADAPQGGQLAVSGQGSTASTVFPTTVAGPGMAPVPEASTTVSFGLLLALGGLAVVAARRKTVKNAA